MAWIVDWYKIFNPPGVVWIGNRAGDNLWASMSNRAKQQNNGSVEEYDRFLHNFIKHRANCVVAAQRPQYRSATRRTARVNCNRDALAGLEAAHFRHRP